MKIVPSACCHDCGGACPLNIHVEQGKVVRIEPHDVGLPYMRPCLRGLLYHYRVYAPDRLKYPLKRTGQRGEGKFRRISWDDALNEVAERLTSIRDKYGPASILALSWSGMKSRLHHAASLRRFLSMAGGFSAPWGGASYQGGFFASIATYGRLDTGNDRADLLNSKMIILWGCNPAESIFGTETRWYLTQAKEKGTKIVCVDPRYTDSAAAWASPWIPIRPGTDAAMLIAMAYVILDRRLQDQEFLDRCTVGFDRFRDYVTGTEDGIPKTPVWAEAITGVPASTISNLAVEYATSKPAAIIAGFAPGRSSRGEQYHRAAATLSAMTGNVGVHGGSTACLDLSVAAAPARSIKNPVNYIDIHADLPVPPNPVEQGQPLHEYAVKGIRSHTADKIAPGKLWDAMLRGKSGGYYSDLHMMYVIGGNAVNQMLATPRAVEAIRKLDFVVVHDQFMTATARFADILLPATTWMERNDIFLPWSFGKYALYVTKAIEPLYETRNDLDIFTDLADRMGLKGYNEKTEEEWLRIIAAKHGIEDFEGFRSSGFYKVHPPEPYVEFADQVKDPVNYPFPTPSGRIEIFCQRIADFNRPEVLPPVPRYVEGWEDSSDPKRQEYPLQLLTTHSRRRTHSQFDNIRWYRQTEPHAVWINPADASSRGIRDGSLVRVFNDRGAVSILAKVTGRIMPGVVAIYQGAWYNPDPTGLDRGGCANVLTRPDHSPGGAFPSNSVLVQVQKLQEDK